MAPPAEHGRRSFFLRFPPHVPLDGRTGTAGEILCGQVKAVGLDARQHALAKHMPNDIPERVLTCVIGCSDA
jgi:hypothetical protein